MQQEKTSLNEQYRAKSSRTLNNFQAVLNAERHHADHVASQHLHTESIASSTHRLLELKGEQAVFYQQLQAYDESNLNYFITELQT